MNIPNQIVNLSVIYTFSNLIWALSQVAGIQWSYNAFLTDLLFCVLLFECARSCSDWVVGAQTPFDLFSQFSKFILAMSVTVAPLRHVGHALYTSSNPETFHQQNLIFYVTFACIFFYMNMVLSWYETQIKEFSVLVEPTKMEKSA